MGRGVRGPAEGKDWVVRGDYGRRTDTLSSGLVRRRGRLFSTYCVSGGRLSTLRQLRKDGELVQAELEARQGMARG